MHFSSKTYIVDRVFKLIRSDKYDKALTVIKNTNPTFIQNQIKAYTFRDEEKHLWIELSNYARHSKHKSYLLDLELLILKNCTLSFYPITNLLRISVSRSNYEQHVGYFDTESIHVTDENGVVSEELTPYILVACLSFHKFKYEVWDGKNFIYNFLIRLGKYIDKEKIKDLTLFAHNFSGHDGILIIEAFAQVEGSISTKVNVIIHNRLLYLVTIEGKGDKGNEWTINFQCRLLLLKTGLAKLGEIYKAPRNKYFIPYNALTSIDDLNKPVKDIINKLQLTNEEKTSIETIINKFNCKTIKEYAFHYCKQDVFLLKYVVEGFIEQYKYETSHQSYKYSDFITISRLSIITWYTIPNINRKNVISIEGSTKIHNFIRKAYYGGKTEIYQGYLENSEQCYYYDFPGIYGIAITILLPTGSPVRIRKVSNTNLKEWINNLHKNNICGFLSVKFTTPDNIIYPILPIKGRIDKLSREKLLFCVGTSIGVYYSYELEFAIEIGYKIEEIHIGYIFKRGHPLQSFSNYIIEKKNIAKLEQNDVKTILYKLLNNSLYGKFAIQPVKRSYFASHELLKDSKKLHSFVTFGDNISLITENLDLTKSRSKRTNISLSAAVRSWGRIILQKRIFNIIKQNPGSKLIYVDTDRIFISHHKEIKCKHIWDNIRWKTIAIYTKVHFIGPKIYILWDRKINKWIIKRKGVKAEKIDIEKIIELGKSSTRMLVENNILWQKRHIKQIKITFINKILRPFHRTKRIITWKWENRSQYWTGKTMPFNFNTVVRSNNTHLIEWLKEFPNPQQINDISPSVKIRAKTFNEAKQYYTYQSCTLKYIIPSLSSNDLPYDNYKVELRDDSKIDDLYFLTIHLLQTTYQQLGFIIHYGPTNFNTTLSPSYIPNADEIREIGASNFAIMLGNSIRAIIEKYIIEESELNTLYRKDEDTYIIARFIK